MADTDRRIQKSEKVVGAGSALPDVANRRLDGYHDASGAHRWVGGSNVASASSITPPDDSNYFTVTGTTTIAGISAKDSTYPGVDLIVRFASALTLTHSASFLMPSSVDYQVSAGEIVRFHEATSGNYQFVSGSGTFIAPAIPGALSRPQYTWATISSVLIDAGWYHTDGATEQIVFWNSQLTFTFGSGGSNSSSTNLGASQTHYLYIDDSSVTAKVALTASNFINSTTAPTYSQAKHGWYNGNDRCIGAFATSAASQLNKFAHDGGDLFYFDVRSVDAIGITPSSTWTDVALSIPNFSTKALVAHEAKYVDTNATLRYRTKGSSGTGHHAVTVSSTHTADMYNTIIIITDSSQTTQVNFNVATAGNTVSLETCGYYYPKGM